MRIFGVHLNEQKSIGIALCQVYGIGRTKGKKVCEDLKIDFQKKVFKISLEEEELIKNYIEKNFVVEDDLKSLIDLNIKKKISMGSYEGQRWKKHLPIAGRTRSNGKTAKKIMGKARG
jgi:small subunit ribosomal protein S13